MRKTESALPVRVAGISGGSGRGASNEPARSASALSLMGVAVGALSAKYILVRWKNIFCQQWFDMIARFEPVVEASSVPPGRLRRRTESRLGDENACEPYAEPSPLPAPRRNPFLGGGRPCRSLRARTSPPGTERSPFRSNPAPALPAGREHGTRTTFPWRRASALSARTRPSTAHFTYFDSER